MKTLNFFIDAVGRRKIAVVNLRLIPGSGKIQINGRPAEEFFAGHLDRLDIVQKPFRLLNQLSFDAKATARGGGLQGQAYAIQLALARALLRAQPANQKLFRDANFLNRDSRVKERRKYGLKKARKAPQFSKRLF
jgi:small subunit ribosomal protein S9